MANRVISVPAKWSRRMPDPNFEGAETHFILVPAAELPVGLPLDANPREPMINRPVYRSITRSLRQEDDSVRGSFHLKHRGITLVASAVTKSVATRSDGFDMLELHFPEEGTYGIVDGGHSYEIVQQSRKNGDIPEDEYIKLEVLTGLQTESLVTEIAGGRNTSMQVQAKSLLDLKDAFQFLKDVLADEDWSERIAWHEGEDGDVDVVDIIATISCFDIATWPGRHQGHPVDAYRRKKTMLERFEDDVDRYRRLTPVIRDVLYLHDWITYDSEARWQEIGGRSGTGGKYRSLEMVETAKPGRPSFDFPFLRGITSANRLRRPAVLPILGAFRSLLEEDPNAEPFGAYRPARWAGGGFDEVIRLWSEAGGRLLRTFYEYWDSTSRDLHAAGRSPALWGSLYNEFQVIKMERNE